MLVLSRKLQERIIINQGEIIITLVGIRDGSAAIGIDAPKDMRVDREEVSLRIQRGEPRKGGVV